MHKLKRSLAALLCVLTLFGVGAKDVGYAATADITGAITAQKATAEFRYEKTGHQLMVRLKYYETHTSTGSKYEDSVVNSTSYISAAVSKTADSGYNLTKMDAYGTVDSVLVAAIYGLTP